jgi:hypothetical protein
MSTGAKEDESSTWSIWAAGFHHVMACSSLVRILKLMSRLFNFQIVFHVTVNHGYLKPRTLNQWIGGHDYTWY